MLIAGIVSQAEFDPPAQSEVFYQTTALPPSHHGWMHLTLIHQTKGGQTWRASGPVQFQFCYINDTYDLNTRPSEYLTHAHVLNTGKTSSDSTCCLLYRQNKRNLKRVGYFLFHPRFALAAP